MPAEQCGRWISAVGTAALVKDGSPAGALVLACALHALSEVSKGIEPGPAAAVLTISGPDGSVLGQFAADTQDAEILAKRFHDASYDPEESEPILDIGIEGHSSPDVAGFWVVDIVGDVLD
ncbi:hypothetical protein ACWD25_18165 [Streptomyces sp. NPDC002920]